MTKDEHTTEEKKDGSKGKPRLKAANYNISRNMPLPEPKVDKLRRWKKEQKPSLSSSCLLQIHSAYEDVSRTTD